MSVVIVDAGGANLGSVRYALRRLGVEPEVATAADAIRAAERVIIPGVGAAAPAMARLRALQLVDVLRSLTQPVLGVCLGMQLLCTRSDEGGVDCLGVIDALVEKFAADATTRIPHMGWNRASACRDHALCAGAAANGWAYFVHSYAVPVCPATLAACDHGRPFSAAIARGNFMGVQYHPERSSAFGAAVLRNFLSL